MKPELMLFAQFWRLAATVWLVGGMHAANASTPAEEQLFKAPMPHARMDARATVVKVHLAQLNGYLEGQPGNAVRLAQLKQQVGSCVASLQRTGAPTHPPTRWPDFVTSVREDTYFAANRGIRYSSGIAYLVNPADCSLIEGATSTASLISEAGSCMIDLVAKTARGACATSANVRSARSTLHGTPPGSPLKTGATREIVGMRCDVWRMPELGDGATLCLANGGSFTPSRMAGNTALAGMPIEYDSATGVKMKAVLAKYDVDVDVRVFEPHLQGDFQITNTASHKK